jgi:hypothetical protein
VPLPWLGILDAVLSVSALARSRRPSVAPDEPRSRRTELEREQFEAERLRAERALRLELRRQAGDREIGRLRLLAGVTVASWIGTLFFSTRLLAGGVGPRVALGVGWLLLLAAIAASFVAQSRVARSLDCGEDDAASRAPLSSGAGGTIAPWLLVSGLALVGVAMLLL